MAITVAKLGFNLSLAGNKANETEGGAPDVGAPARGLKGYEEWLQANVTTLYDVNYEQSQNIQVVIYE